MGKAEIEHRFLVKSLDLGFLHPYFKSAISIQQCYFEIPSPTTSFRIRITNNSVAKINIKTGCGLMRDEDEYEIDLFLGSSLLEICHHQLNKTRLEVDGWEIDFFDNPLSGIIFAEKEMKSEVEKVVLPPWIREAVEVTDRLTNLHMARLASELRGTDVPISLNYVTGQR